MANRGKICIVSQSHLCRNPRVLKEAIALSDAGYVVYVLTSIYSDELLKEDLSLIYNRVVSYQFYSDLRSKGVTSFKQRAIKKTAVILKTQFGLETRFTLGSGINNLKRRCKDINAGLYIMHQELATYIGTKLIKKGYKVAFDMEDWYSEDLLPKARNKRPLKLLRKAESFALNNGLYCTTTSNVLANKLSQAYSCTLPYVIYNVFLSQNKLTEIKKGLSKPLKLFWFSQTIGPGRGLEQFIELTAALKTKLELHLLGNISANYHEKLHALMPKQHQLYFHEVVAEQKLAEKIAGFDIGLALELDTPMSRNYTITNKFFQYLQSGLPVIATETAGQNEVFEKYKPGFKLSANPSKDEIFALENWLTDTDALMEARQGAIKAAQYYNWENESKKLMNLIDHAFEHAS